MLLACFIFRLCVHVLVCFAGDSMNVVAAVCLGVRLRIVAMSYLPHRFRKCYDGGVGPPDPGMSWRWVAPQIQKVWAADSEVLRWSGARLAPHLTSRNEMR